MTPRRAFLVLAIPALWTIEPAPARTTAKVAGSVAANCTYSGRPLMGKVKVVEHFPDIKVKIVRHFPDLKVKPVEHFPDACGKWKFVEHFEDFSVKYVEHFPDLEIKFVEHFPGLP